MSRWQAKRLDDVDYRLPRAVLEDHVGKLREAIVGALRWSSGPEGTPGVIVTPFSRRLLA
jgi:hypothetical protein